MYMMPLDAKKLALFYLQCLGDDTDSSKVSNWRVLTDKLRWRQQRGYWCLTSQVLIH